MTGSPPRRVTTAPRIALVVVGMHRSGTSALTRLISQLGYALPRTLLGANPGNPLGHWESSEVIRFDDELLAAAGTDWMGIDEIGESLRDMPARDAAIRRGVALLKSEFGRSRRFVLKDPRICRLLPFWLDTLAASGAASRLVYTSRAPGEVAASLAAREGIDPRFVELLWLRSVLDAEAAGRGRPRVHLTYAMLLDDWRHVVERLCVGLALPQPCIAAPVAAEIGATLRPEHRHHRDVALASIGRAAEWIATVAEILARWAAQGEDDRDHPTLDAVGSEFAAMMSSFGTLLRAGLRGIVEARWLGMVRVDLDARLAAERDRADAAEHRLAGLDRTSGEMLEHAAAPWIRASGFFDPGWYLERYPDVAATGLDPADHFLRFGAIEGYDPGPRFSTRRYLDTYADIAASGVNPLVHFLVCGRAEGRSAFAAEPCGSAVAEAGPPG